MRFWFDVFKNLVWHFSSLFPLLCCALSVLHVQKLLHNVIYDKIEKDFNSAKHFCSISHIYFVLLRKTAAYRTQPRKILLADSKKELLRSVFKKVLAVIFKGSFDHANNRAWQIAFRV